MKRIISLLMILMLTCGLLCAAKAEQPASWMQDLEAAETAEAAAEAPDAAWMQNLAGEVAETAEAEQPAEQPAEETEAEQPAEGTETEQPAEQPAETPAEEPAEAPAAPEGFNDVQYIMYVGTNDKDTNEPVYPEEECMEKAKEILIRHFGGYTIQEARGGWIDGDNVYQEYTLVIYLSDTTPEQVHAAADDMIETFRQSSILIQENPTRTEFYAGN